MVEKYSELNQSIEEKTSVLEGTYGGSAMLIKKNNRVTINGMIWNVSTALKVPEGFRPTKLDSITVFCDCYNGTWGHVGSLTISKDGTTVLNSPIGMSPNWYFSINGTWDV